MTRVCVPLPRRDPSHQAARKSPSAVSLHPRHPDLAIVQTRVKYISLLSTYTYSIRTYMQTMVLIISYIYTYKLTYILIYTYTICIQKKYLHKSYIHTIHTCMHTYIYSTYIYYTYINTYIHTYKHALTPACRVHSCIHTYSTSKQYIQAVHTYIHHIPFKAALRRLAAW